MGRYKLDLYNNISELDIKKINKYAEILDADDFLEVYIHDQCVQVDALRENVFKKDFECTFSKEFEKDHKVINYIKLIKKE